jgi:hypothetical protein
MTDLKPASTNLPYQLPKLSLLRFVETSDEIKIVECLEKSTQIANLQNLLPLLEVVAKWRMYIGIPKDDNSMELAIVRDFIREEYPHLTLKEIELAYTLSAKNKLQNCEYYGAFSPFYVGRVLDSYMYYRKMTLAEPIRRKEKYKYLDEEEKNKPTPQEEAKLTQELFKHFYEQHKNGEEISDVFNLCWNYLRSQKVINPVKEEYEAAMRYGQDKVLNKKKDFFEKFQFNTDNEQKKYARNFCLLNFFVTIYIVIFLITIKPEHFS